MYYISYILIIHTNLCFIYIVGNFGGGAGGVGPHLMVIRVSSRLSTQGSFPVGLRRPLAVPGIELGLAPVTPALFL